jgi:hypothetical protein
LIKNYYFESTAGCCGILPLALLKIREREAKVEVEVDEEVV